MFERFTDRARRVVVLAQEEARLLNHNYIGTEHILLGLIHEGEGVAAQVLSALHISLEATRAEVAEVIGQGVQAPSGHIPFTPRAKKVLELSLREALELGHNYIGTEHILLGLIREGEGVAAQVLNKLGADLGRVRVLVGQLLAGYEGKRVVGGAGGAAVRLERAHHVTTPSGQPVCSFCGRDLWEAAHYVRGETGAICDACVVAASAALAGAPADEHAVVLPYRVHGDAPTEDAADQIAAAVRGAFGTFVARSMLASVERGDELVELMERNLAGRVADRPPFTIVIDRIRFLDDVNAVVRMRQVVGGNAARSYEVLMIRADGRWLVAQQSFVEVLPLRDA